MTLSINAAVYVEMFKDLKQRKTNPVSCFRKIAVMASWRMGRIAPRIRENNEETVTLPLEIWVQNWDTNVEMERGDVTMFNFCPPSFFSLQPKWFMKGIQYKVTVKVAVITMVQKKIVCIYFSCHILKTVILSPCISEYCVIAHLRPRKFSVLAFQCKYRI